MRDAVPMTVNGTDALVVKSTPTGNSRRSVGVGSGAGAGITQRRPSGAFAGVAFTLAALGALDGAAVNGAIEFFLIPFLAVGMVWLYRVMTSAWVFAAIGIVSAFVFGSMGLGSTSLFVPVAGIVGAIMIAVHDRKHARPDLDFDARQAGRAIDRR